jgi:CBS domain-containing protein
MAAVRDLLKTKGNLVWTVHPDAPVLEALELMASKHLGAVIVCSADTGICPAPIDGIFTERDYVRKAAAGLIPALDVPVRQLMTTPVYFVQPDQTVDECMTLMTARRVRHLPVIAENRLVGLISIRDVLRQVILEKETTIQDLEHYISGQ